MAKIKIRGPKGAREVAADQFFVTPKAEGERETVLQPGEIVTEVTLPPPEGVSKLRLMKCGIVKSSIGH